MLFIARPRIECLLSFFSSDSVSYSAPFRFDYFHVQTVYNALQRHSYFPPLLVSAMKEQDFNQPSDTKVWINSTAKDYFFKAVFKFQNCITYYYFLNNLNQQIVLF